MTKGRMIVAELDEDHLGRGARADPSDRAIAGGVVGEEQRLDVRGDQQAFVSFVRDMERAVPRGDGMMAGGSDPVFFAEFYRRVGDAALALQPVEPAHDFLVPPGPLLEVEDAVMENQD